MIVRDIYGLKIEDIDVLEEVTIWLV